jgi:hypothetical protein
MKMQEIFISESNSLSIEINFHDCVCTKIGFDFLLKESSFWLNSNFFIIFQFL